MAPIERRLRYAAELNPSVRANLLESQDTEVSFLPMEAIGEEGSLDLSRTRPVAEVRSGYTYFEDGDVAFAKVTPCFENGKGALMKGLEGGVGFGTTELTVLRPKAGIDARYLNYIVRAASFRHLGAGAMTGAGGLKRVPDEFTRNFKATFPTKDVQRRVADFLDEQTARIDALIAGKEKLAATLDEWYSAELQTLCCGRDRASEHTGNAWIPAIPKGWRLVRLKHLVRGIEQGWSPECEARLAEDDEWGILKAGAANRGIYRGNEEHKALPSALAPLPGLEVKPGNVLITRASGSAELVGSFAYVYSTRPKLMLSDKNFRLVFDDSPALDAELLAWACNTHPIREQIRQFVSGAEGLAKNIGSGNLREIWLPVPPKGEQEGILRDIRILRKQHVHFQEHLFEHIARLREYRSSLISAAVTGQIDVNSFQLEAA